MISVPYFGATFCDLYQVIKMFSQL